MTNPTQSTGGVEVAKRGSRDGRTGHQIIEDALAKAVKGDHNNSPSSLGPDEGIAFQAGLAAAYLHALEMIPLPDGTYSRPSAEGSEVAPDYFVLDDEGKAMIVTSLHYTPDNIRALIERLKVFADPVKTTQADFDNLDWRSFCNVLSRVMMGLACDLPATGFNERQWDQAVSSAKEWTLVDGTRFKLNLNSRGQASNHFPLELDGRWVAFQHAEDDAHVPLSLMLDQANAALASARESEERLVEALNEMSRRVEMIVLGKCDPESVIDDGLITQVNAALAAHEAKSGRTA